MEPASLPSSHASPNSSGVTANGANLPGAVVKLTGRKVNSYITSTDGTFQFNSLPAGGDYTVTATLAGFTFAPQMIGNLQNDVNLTISALSSCQYAVSAPGTTVGSTAGTAGFDLTRRWPSALMPVCCATSACVSNTAAAHT